MCLLFLSYALATLKPDHACLIPARLHQIGNCKKNCRHGSGVMPVVGRKLEGTFLDYPHFDLLFPCFQSFFSLRLMFLQVSFKILVQTSRHWAGMSKETRLQNGEKISRDWSVSVAIWSSRCQCSQSIKRNCSLKTDLCSFFNMTGNGPNWFWLPFITRSGRTFAQSAVQCC